MPWNTVGNSGIEPGLLRCDSVKRSYLFFPEAFGAQELGKIALNRRNTKAAWRQESSHTPEALFRQSRTGGIIFP